MDSGTAAIIGALIGASAGVLSNFGVEMYKRHRDKKALASVLAAEISSTLRMTERRGYEELYRNLLKKLEDGQDVKLPDILEKDPSRDNPILNTHLHKLGLLRPQLAERIGHFYQQMHGVRSDVRSLGQGRLDGFPELKARLIREDLPLWEETARLGHELIQELHREAE